MAEQGTGSTRASWWLLTFTLPSWLWEADSSWTEALRPLGGGLPPLTGARLSTRPRWMAEGPGPKCDSRAASEQCVTSGGGLALSEPVCVSCGMGRRVGLWGLTGHPSGSAQHTWAFWDGS